MSNDEPIPGDRWDERALAPIESDAPILPASQIIDQIHEIYARVENLPRIGRIEVGPEALNYFRRTIPPAPALRPGQLGDPFGVPIIPNDELAPRAWRVLDTAGEVLSEGSVPA